jgi:hypothetical protein
MSCRTGGRLVAWARRRLGVTIAISIAVGLVLLASPSPARAACDTYTNVIDWDMLTEATTYGTFTVSSDCANIFYRWVDDPDHTTVIAANNAIDGALIGSNSIPAHSTSYVYVAGYVPGGRFLLRGRVANGAGPFYNHDGRLKR